MTRDVHYNAVRDLHYLDSESGKVVETIKMREFYEWNTEKRAYDLVRHYQLALESKFNPGFGNPPQNDRAFGGAK